MNKNEFYKYKYLKYKNKYLTKKKQILKKVLIGGDDPILTPTQTAKSNKIQELLKNLFQSTDCPINLKTLTNFIPFYLSFIKPTCNDMKDKIVKPEAVTQINKIIINFMPYYNYLTSIVITPPTQEEFTKLFDSCKDFLIFLSGSAVLKVAVNNAIGNQLNDICIKYNVLKCNNNGCKYYYLIPQ